MVLTLPQAQQLLGVDTPTFQLLTPKVTVSHLTRRVESVGRVGESRYRIAVIARIQTDGSLSYLARTED